MYRDLVQEALSYINTRITWLGESFDEVGVDQNGTIRVKCNSGLFRPNDVEHLEGDFTNAKNKLGWSPKVSFKELIKEMMEEELIFINNFVTNVTKLKHIYTFLFCYMLRCKVYKLFLTIYYTVFP